MFKTYLADRNKSIYSLSKESGIPYSTLNDLANGKVAIDNCKVGLVRRLSDVLGLSMDDIYTLCSGPERKTINSYGVEICISVSNKNYCARFEYDQEPVELRLCRITEDSSYYIDEIARWRSESYIRQRRMEGFF